MFAIVLLLGHLAVSAQKWLPDHTKLQYAGGIGFLSVGVGYHNKKDKLQGDVFYGFTPASVGGLDIHALTVKGTWFPLKPINRKTWQLRPLSTGLQVNYTFGKQYFGFTPDNYPYDYYKFPTALHAGAFIGGQVNKQVSSRRGIKRIGLYYELGTYDVELASYVRNRKALSVPDILNLGIGIVTSF
ncbi:hypothetical protein [Flavisolibacter tropicus]|uniref:Outer membrane protein beta-barrel domain-containing protein n=1 Tax=Flavisolibacter tropicus TaxID=1492898 RepID=A0A172TYC2_9BACT|nr:hypothetical protein [Flavisolibacter tropicus]ANE52040.1 hypothetical protein SY85_17595 [Flavisolibacter tropicus]